MKREIEFLPIKTYVFDSPAEAVESAAREMANWMRTRKFQRAEAVLGFPTGDAVAPFYEKIIEMSGVEEKGGLPISAVRGFLQGELAGQAPDAAGSLQHWLRERFHTEWGSTPEHQHVPDATVADAQGACDAYEELLKTVGPMDLALVPFGANGALGFNEPGTPGTSRARPIELSDALRAEYDAAHEGLTFGSSVLGMGLGSIRGSKRVRVYAFGKDKAEAIEAAMLPEHEPEHPLSVLAGHKDVELLLDAESASLLE